MWGSLPCVGTIHLITERFDLFSILTKVIQLKVKNRTLPYKTVLLRDRKRRTARAPTIFVNFFCQNVFVTGSGTGTDTGRIFGDPSPLGQ